MKIVLNYSEIERIMAEKRIMSYRQLSEGAGLPLKTVYNNRNYAKSVTITTAWLIADYLGCKIDDIVKPEWD